jgi:hypothetical protein
LISLVTTPYEKRRNGSSAGTKRRKSLSKVMVLVLIMSNLSKRRMVFAYLQVTVAVDLRSGKPRTDSAYLGLAKSNLKELGNAMLQEVANSDTTRLQLPNRLTSLGRIMRERCGKWKERMRRRNLHSPRRAVRAGDRVVMEADL